MTSSEPKRTNPRRIAKAVLTWYDKNARELPWRVGPLDRAAGVKIDPYRVWLSEIMLQQTTVATVRPRFDEFLSKWPTVTDLANTPQEEVLAAWAGLGYYARARNMHACAQIVRDQHGGVFPATEDELLALPGVGAYTAAAIAAIAFDQRAVVVDGNIERVASRVFQIEKPIRDAKPLIKTSMDSVWPKKRSGDFAQALMDIGATICTPKNPSCLICPLTEACAVSGDGADRLPVKAPKKTKPTRLGTAWAVFSQDGKVLLVKRPEKGLLGGMLALPSAGWSGNDDEEPTALAWDRAGAVSHVFTHFRLEMAVSVAILDSTSTVADPQGAVWADPVTVGVPTLMRKAIALATEHLDGVGQDCRNSMRPKTDQKSNAA
ncbi:MAG: A/G-specific adenine glycosylase [Pseudomonadota bacterium]